MSLNGSPRRRTLRGRTVGSLGLAALLLLAACGDADGELGGTVVQDGIGCTITEVDRRTDDVPEIEAGTAVAAETTTDDLIEADEDACTAAFDGYLTLDLVGATAADGTVFSDTFADDRPITARLGVNQLLAGLETGLDGMPVGARRQIVVPAAFAYGADGNEEQGIGPDEDLVFVVDLLSITDAPTICNAAMPIPEGTIDGKPTTVALPTEPPTGEVTTTVLTEGDGPEAAADSYVTVHYLGVSCATGMQFDSSWDRGETITAALTDAEPTATAFSVIEGWTQGMIGQRQGSTIQIDIPAELAYGTNGSPPAIGPNDPLTFVVEIVEVSSEAPPDPAAEELPGEEPPADDGTEADPSPDGLDEDAPATDGEG